jgi:hypothetical protein
MITAVVLLLMAGVVGWLASTAFERLESATALIARRKWLAIGLAAVLPVGLRLSLLPVLPPPIPHAHDEFSYLLSADTFTHGRVTNPEPALSKYFESIHILVRPTYSSIFPPAQGAILALGKMITGNHWAGVLLSIALMSASVCWMLQGWLPPAWALLGTGLLIIRLGVFSYWINSFWGGAVPACGGALVLGAVPRLLQRRSVLDSVLLGLGIAILANSRPFEGAVFTALSLCLLAYRATRIPILWPAVVMLLFTIAGIGYCSFRITGNPFLPPYVLYRTTAATAPHFIFLHPRPQQPHWDYEVLRNFYNSEVELYKVARNEPAWAVLVSAEVYWRFYLGILLTLPLVIAFRDSGARSLFGLLIIFFLLALAPQVWHNPHYASPATGLLFLLVTLGMQRLRNWRFAGRLLGPWFTRTLVVATLIFAVRIASIHAADTAGSRWSGWVDQSESFNRALVLRQLPLDKRHLVIVRYRAHHDFNDEWVNNEADIEQARVVWARDRGPFDNRDLITHFRNRQIWLAEPDRNPPRFSLYPANLRVQPEALAREILSQACGAQTPDPCLLSCDQWNFFFNRVTNLEAPNVFSGCTTVDYRALQRPFETWLQWIQAQR